MPTIEYTPDDRTVEVSAADTILQVSLSAGIPHTHVCGGNARCSTCRVAIEDGLGCCSERNDAERELAERLGFEPRIRLACQTHVTGDVRVRRLVLDEEDVTLTSQLTGPPTPMATGQEKRVAILFADIRGFTAFSEALLPYDIIHVLNRYFLQVGRVISEHGGYIDNYMGDGILALFGVDDRIAAAERAIRAGLGMLEVMESINPYLERLHHKQLRLGVGIHYGDVVIGTVGVGEQKRQTVIGDAVNLASRIESANKDVGTCLLISESVYEQVRDSIDLGRQVELALKGKSGEYTLHEVVGMSDSSAAAGQDT